MRNGVTEQELEDKATGKRVTMADIEGAIVGEYYFTGEVGAGVPHKDLGLLTICTLVLWNGWTVLGKSACADPANFNEELGKRLARTDAVNQIWPLMGFELKCRLVNDALLVGSSVVEPQVGFETYIGTKVVNATPATRYAYNELRGWKLPANENGDDEGYMVEYTDRVESPPHVPGFEGYISWSPKEVFERAYRPVRVAKAQPAATSAEGTGKASPVEEKKEKTERVYVPEYDTIVSVPVKEETWSDRLKTELAEVTARYEKLCTYLSTDSFHRLPSVDRKDLYNQHMHMEGYKHALERRLGRYELVISSEVQRQAQQKQQQQQFQNRSSD